MNVSTPILAAATGAQLAPRAMIRLTGPGVRELAARLFMGALMWPGFAAARLRMTESLELPVLVITYASPTSYTGDDVLEILLPGGPELVRRVEARILELGADLGVRRAEPGEFSARAYHAGKLTLDQAEGVAALIAAGTDQQLQSARRVMSGEAGAAYRAWADELTTLAALVEAGIDFTDQEDVVAIAPADLRRRLGAIGQELQRTLGAASGKERPAGLVRVALLGRPNAGKSTLFNRLLGRQRAVVAPIAGTTRDVLAEELALSGSGGRTLRIELLDLAGLDESPRDELDVLGRARAGDALERADIVVWCDPTREFAGPPKPPPRAAVLRVRTKADLAQRKAADADVLGVCALDGWGVDALRDQMFAAAWHAAGRAGGMDLLPRHREALQACAEKIESLMATLDADADALRAHPELIASQLRDAIDALSPLTGRVERDDVLGRVFATFCVGK